jgi:hypothetical protein
MQSSLVSYFFCQRVLDGNPSLIFIHIRNISFPEGGSEVSAFFHLLQDQARLLPMGALKLMSCHVRTLPEMTLNSFC